MPDQPHLAEGARILTICNACRYCEGYCAVFPAMERCQNFGPADLNYLANLCHNCQECFYACQFAPPHEFAVNVPKTLAQIRIDSYKHYAALWPRSVVSALAWLCVLASILAALFHAPTLRGGNFYLVVPHQQMVTLFSVLGILALSLMSTALRSFWRDIKEAGSSKASKQALRDILRLEYLRSGGTGCTYPDETHSQSRRWFHHLTFYGFVLCFASTSVAAAYHYVFQWFPPYSYLSLPVSLGSTGGIGLLVGTLGLAQLKFRQDPATANPNQRGLDWEFLALLFLTSLTGLLLLALRNTLALSGLLFVHLGCVAALFLTMPYGKFVHGLYRSLALLRYAREQDQS